MGSNYWVSPVPPFHIAGGTPLASSTTLTDISATPNITLNTNQLMLGTEIEIYAAGEFSNTSTPTLLLGFYYGGVAGAALAASTAITTTTTLTGVPWQLFYRGVIRAIGSSGSIQGQGRLYLPTSLTAWTIRPIPETKAARTVTIDTSTSKIITVGAQWGTSSASNTITCDDISVKLMN